MSSLTISGGLGRVRPVPTAFQPSMSKTLCTCDPSRPLAVHTLMGVQCEVKCKGVGFPPVTKTVLAIGQYIRLFRTREVVSVSISEHVQCSGRGCRLQ
jgi:hypothetical protein